MSAQAVTGSVPRPPLALMRKPLQNHFKKHLAISMVFGVVTAFAYKFLVSDVRKKNYKTFYE